MIAFRLLGGRLLDAFDKVRIVMATFVIIAIGYVALDNLPGGGAIACRNNLRNWHGNGTAYIPWLDVKVSPPRFRLLNENLILFATPRDFFSVPY